MKDKAIMAGLAPDDTQPLVGTMARLREPGGCPWDREQDHASLRPYLIEEAYEVIEAIDRRDDRELCGELGDLLLQIVFHARLAEERGAFTMRDVVAGIVEKLRRRHPHVFGETRVADAREVITNWEAIKKTEYTDRAGVLDGVPGGLPALSAAHKLQKKAAGVGFDWSDITPVWDKLREETVELQNARGREAVEHELGDVLFSAVNVARHMDCHPEVALNAANSRFRRRFAYVEKCVAASGRAWADFTLAELDEFWRQAKQGE